MNTPSVPRVAVLGCGYCGRNLVRNFHALGALRVVADQAPAARELAALLVSGGSPARRLATGNHPYRDFHSR